MKKCEKCNILNDDQAHFCWNCGAKLPGMLALVCPTCGKVSPIGTKECPVCHTPLKQVQQQVVSITRHDKPQHRRLITVVAIAFVTLSMILTGYYLVATRQVQPLERITGYYKIEMSYFDHHHRPLYTDYYIINQTSKRPDAYHLPIAYLGRGAVGKKQVKGISISVMRKAYERSRQRGQLVMKKYQTVLTCPEKVDISATRRKVFGNNLELFLPSEGYFPVRVNDRPAVCYIKMRVIISTMG